MIKLGAVPDNMTEAETAAYIELMQKQNPEIKAGTLNIRLFNDDEVDLELIPETVKFQRIRRITGYLVGTLDRFNNAKYSEVGDRVKHDMSAQIDNAEHSESGLLSE